MLEFEINSVMKELNMDIPIRWLERGLHNDPQHLNKVLQECLDSLSSEDTILLGFSACGGATFNLECKSERMVLPRFDDCIRAVISDNDKVDPYSLYYTRGWLDCEHSLPNEYKEYLTKYGDKRADRMRKALVGNYHSFCAVDTGFGDFDEWQTLAKSSADLLKLQYCSCLGSMQIYRKLLSGNWDNDFIIKTCGEIVKYSDFASNNFND